MIYNKRLKNFFREKGFKTNKSVALDLEGEYSAAMIGRFFKDEKINLRLIELVTKKHPDVNWNEIFAQEGYSSGSYNVAAEPSGYGYSDPMKIIEEIEKKLAQLKTAVTQN